MPARLTRPLDLLLGTERRQRLRLARMLMAVGVFAFSLAAQWFSVGLGISSAGKTWVLTVLIVVAQVGFYAAIRSGWSERLADPALTLPQMTFAIASLAMAYGINPPVRGMLLMIVALVLFFGAFTLKPRQCRLLGGLAVAVMGSAMAWGMAHDPAAFTPLIESYHFLFALIVLPTMGVLAGQLSQLRLDLQQQRRELRTALDRVQELATRDELTGLPNRRHVQEWMAHEVARSHRPGRTLSVALLDLDHFKRVNDVHGHATGDDVLRRFSTAARQQLHEGDVLARWGGEEFLLVMPGTGLAAAERRLMDIRDHVAHPAHWAGCAAGRITFSGGVSEHPASQGLDAALLRADLALYAAKAQGRDVVFSVSVAEPTPRPVRGRSGAGSPSASAACLASH